MPIGDSLSRLMHSSFDAVAGFSQSARTLLWCTWIAIAAVGCDHDDPSTVPNPKPLMERASQISVFLGHQSVGENILGGVAALVREQQTEWRIIPIELEQRQWPSQVGLWHAKLGENGAPSTKIDAFASALRTWSGTKPTIAMLKLCFVDVTESTDVPLLLSYYQTTLQRLKGEFPDVHFGHVTVPLATQTQGLKATIKRAIGRRVVVDFDNAARTKYNRQLRVMFPNDPIFDLELVESTRRDGTRVERAVGNERSFSLASDYASDPWGHLNEQGSRLAARAFTQFVVDTAKP